MARHAAGIWRNIDTDGTLRLRIAISEDTPMVRHDRIDMQPDVMYGKPVIRGTRVTV